MPAPAKSEAKSTSAYQSAKTRVYEIMTVADPSDLASRVFGFFITGLIILNVIVVITLTDESLSARFERTYYYFEMAVTIIFSVEYVLRLWACTADPRYARPLAGRLRYAVTPMALVDLVAIVPFYVSVLAGAEAVNTTWFRAIRLFRLARLFKTSRYFQSSRIMGRVVWAKRQELVITLVTVAILLLVFSGLMWFVESKAQPDKFGSIIASLWWGVNTLSTVGFGDVVPETNLGKLISGLVALLGIALFALPAGILASGFAEELRARKHHTKTCPHCGREIE
jgi:voltage-gated potassium channel